MNRRCIIFYLCFFAGIHSFAQSIQDTINSKDAGRIIRYLASDELRGRVNFSKEQLQAATFISNEFSAYGLHPYPAFNNFYQPFRTSIGGRNGMVDIKWNGNKLNDSLFYFFTYSPDIDDLDLDSFFVLQVYPPISDSILYRNWTSKENILIQVMTNDSVSLTQAMLSSIIS